MDSKMPQVKILKRGDDTIVQHLVYQLCYNCSGRLHAIGEPVVIKEEVITNASVCLEQLEDFKNFRNSEN